MHAYRLRIRSINCLTEVLEPTCSWNRSVQKMWIFWRELSIYIWRDFYQCMSVYKQLNDFWVQWSNMIKDFCGPLCPELYNVDFLLITVGSIRKTLHFVNIYNFIVRVSGKSKWFKKKRHRMSILLSERVSQQIRYFSLALKGSSPGTCLSLLMKV